LRATVPVRMLALALLLKYFRGLRRGLAECDDAG
jgi:hypothetical protein